MKPSQPQLPFSTAPINWLETVAFKFNQLRDVSTAADKAGFRIVRLKVVPGGYEAQFQPGAEKAASAKPSPVDPVQKL